MVPEIRIRALNGAPLRERGRHVLYWMTAFRRPAWNFALERAADLARTRRVPLVVLEALRCDHPWASRRFHRFVADGMRDNAAAFAAARTAYHPYLEPAPGAGRGLLAALARDAVAVVGDDFPAFFLPRLLARAAEILDVRVEAVDGNGLLPVRATEKVFPTAHGFRRFLQKQLRPHLDAAPREDPLSGLPPGGGIPDAVLKRWPAAGLDPDLDAFPVDPAVRETPLRGGSRAASRALRAFLSRGLDAYPEARNHPDDDAGSGLSPWLHFGHVSTWEALAGLARRECWTAKRFGAKPDGSRGRTWGMGPAAEAFLDQLVTWRELGFNMAALRPGHDRYESLPAWARATLEAHAGDRRDPGYRLEDFEAARTHDPLWNATQRQLVREGRLHNYLRMLWGKKILEWSASPREALRIMIHLNDRYALDGRDPNSLSGIFWILGRYDRAWGPERPVFGKIRYMSSASTLRKVRVKRYLERYGPTPDPAPDASRAPGRAASAAASPPRRP
jgi:deoxyribodipyrimidine photo-lyase